MRNSLTRQSVCVWFRRMSGVSRLTHNNRWFSLWHKAHVGWIVRLVLYTVEICFFFLLYTFGGWASISHYSIEGHQCLTTTLGYVHSRTSRDFDAAFAWCASLYLHGEEKEEWKVSMAGSIIHARINKTVGRSAFSEHCRGKWANKRICKKMCLRKAIWKMKTTMMAQQLKADNDGRSCECSHRLACHCTRHVSFSGKKTTIIFQLFHFRVKRGVLCCHIEKRR